MRCHEDARPIPSAFFLFLPPPPSPERDDDRYRAPLWPFFPPPFPSSHRCRTFNAAQSLNYPFLFPFLAQGKAGRYRLRAKVTSLFPPTPSSPFPLPPGSQIAKGGKDRQDWHCHLPPLLDSPSPPPPSPPLDKEKRKRDDYEPSPIRVRREDLFLPPQKVFPFPSSPPSGARNKGMSDPLGGAFTPFPSPSGVEIGDRLRN